MLEDWTLDEQLGNSLHGFIGCLVRSSSHRTGLRAINGTASQTWWERLAGTPRPTLPPARPNNMTPTEDDVLL